ncbi:nuclease-related domain-containing protein [Thioalkalivibrio sp. AKL7]|uniref:nuclease-related domain-containing protein n=1 Tax=Thioalkalivibrio sp. AKL7 TaxID=1158155 RepID=UPI00036C31FE|nr:nuclease-related domain-containing protein [Thioalkalivibrio sp. AKL7]
MEISPNKEFTMAGKSPLKAKPLRNPGESLARHIDETVDREAMKYVLFALVLLAFTALEWIRSVTGTEPIPGVFSVVALVAVMVAAYKVVRTKKKVRAMKLGLDGEKAVGQYLERLRANGAQVLHDFPGEGFNVDHVVVHPSGVYAIETKAYSKPVTGEPQIVFDGEHVEIMGRRPERDPIRQARACASWVRERIEETTGKKVPVRPVVVFPGWFIQPTAQSKKSDAWVLNPKALPAFIAHSDTVLADSDVHLIASSLARYVRNS